MSEKLSYTDSEKWVHVTGRRALWPELLTHGTAFLYWVSLVMGGGGGGGVPLGFESSEPVRV